MSFEPALEDDKEPTPVSVLPTEASQIHVPINPLDDLAVSKALYAYRVTVGYVLMASLWALCDGYQISLNGGVINNQGFINTFGTVIAADGSKSIYTTYLSAWGGMQSTGQVIGMCSNHFLADAMGRRRAQWLLLFVLCISVMVESIAHNWWQWLIAKILAGVGVGMLQASMPVYLFEISPAQLRGLLISSYMIWFVVGQFCSSIALNFLNISRPLDYKTAIYTQWGFIGGMVIIAFFLPESPWWLVAKDRIDDATKVLQQLRRGVNGVDISLEIEIMQATLEEERLTTEVNNRGGFWEFAKGLNGWRTLIAAWPKMIGQLTGVALVNNYSTYFFALAGASNPFRVTVILNCVQLITYIVVGFICDKYGRRNVIVIGSAGTTIAATCVGIIGCFDYESAALGGLLVFFTCVCISMNTAPDAIAYAVLAEVPAQRWRARSAGFAVAMAATLGVIFNWTVPYMLDSNPGAGWGVKTGFFFAGTGTIASVVAFFIVPETARRSAAEIDELFEKRVPPRKFKSTVLEHSDHTS